MRHNGYAADRHVVWDDDRHFDRDRGYSRKCVDACGNETGNRQHSFVAIVITEARNMEVDRSRGCTMAREMRVHLPRVVMGSLVVVEMDVCHRSGDGAHLDCNG